MELKAKTRYKHTEVGMIPEDWEVKVLGELCEVKSGKRLPLGNYLTKRETPHPYIRVTDMHMGGVSLTEIMYVPESIYPVIKNYRIFLNEIFISVAGTLGIIGKIPESLDGANLTENANKLTNIKCNTNYLQFVLMSDLIQNTIEGEKTLGAQPKLALTRIRQFKIPLPPNIEEQTTIANALSDADGLISSLEKLIAKKKLIKQGAIQKLLSPKKGWEVKRLGEVCNILKGQLITRETKTHGEIPVIAGGKTPAYFHNKANRKENTITISSSGANAGYISFHKRPIFASDCSTIEANENYNINYIFYFLQSKQDKIYKMQTGGAQPHIHPRDLYPLEIPWPNLYEQDDIATILSDMDAEITALEAKLEKYRQLKQGMMQNLLTGKIRLV